MMIRHGGEIRGVTPVRGPVCASTDRHANSLTRVPPVRGPVCASTGRRHAWGKIPAPLSEAQDQCAPQRIDITGTASIVSSGIFVGVVSCWRFPKNQLAARQSPRTQETVSPKSDYMPRNAEGRSICIKAEKIVGDRGPKGMRDSKPAGSTSMLGGISTTAGTTEFGTLLTPADYSGFRSSVVDPLCHADIGEPQLEVWTYFRGEPARSCGFDSGFICMGFAACLQAKCSSVEQLQKLDQGVVVRLGGAQGDELRYDV
ncbi:hypothetical protein B0H13DRAFT_1918761 [Mycena leptocephala]|nr:hypothetical protein B0H13DRAFT_1918761 [Mycena leptocephala]